MKTISIIRRMMSLSAPTLLLIACGTQAKQDYSAPKAVSGDCRPGTQKPAIYFYKAVADDGSGPLQTVYSLGVANNSCELRFVPLDAACTESDIRAMTGLNTSPLLEMSAEQWDSFATSSEKGPAQRELYRPISCQNKVDAGLEQPELHMITGNGGYSSLEIQSKKPEGKKTHYVAPNSCWSFNRKLAVMGRAAVQETPDLFKPLSLNPGDEALYLTCAQESTPYMNPDGWNLFRDGDISMRQYIARYYVGGKFDQVELIIDKIDNEYASEENVGDFEKKLAKTFQTRVSRIIPGVRIASNENYLTLDLCIEKCGQAPSHTFWKDGQGYPYSVQPEVTVESDGEIMAPNPKASELRRWYSPTAEAIDYLEVKMPELSGTSAPDETIERWTFASCDASSDLMSRFGFRRAASTGTPSWLEMNELARKETISGPFTRIPCIGEQVCRKPIKANSDLSNTGSSRYNGLSLLLQRPTDVTDVCANARKIELVFEGNANVDLRSWKVGNIPGAVPYDEIKLRGMITATGEKPVLTLKGDCSVTTPCANPTEPVAALELVGDARFSVEDLSFSTTIQPYAKRSMAIRSLGTTKKPRIHLKGLSITAESNAFHSGMELSSSEVYLIDSTVTGYYRGVTASNSLLAISGRPTAGTSKSAVELALPTTWPEKMPGKPFFDGSMARGIDLDSSHAYILRTRVDAPKAIASKAAVGGKGNELMLQWSELTNSARHVPGAAVYAQGPLSADISLGFIHDTQALVEFVDSNNAGSRINFQGFVDDSFVFYKEPVINLGNANVNVTRCAEFADKRCYLQ